MNPHAEALLNRIQQELADLSARTVAKEQALEAIRRQGEERWHAWQAQWQHWRERLHDRNQGLHVAARRGAELVEQTQSELEEIEGSVRQCVAVGASVAT